MLQITINGSEYYDDNKQEVIYIKPQTITLEHSLVSISKWEAKWKKPFIGKTKTPEEILDYVKCMTITQNVNPLLYYSLSDDNLKEINDYIEDPMTATWFSKTEEKSFNREIITSEVIYYQMIVFNIPVEFQKWHINRLLTLIKVCGEKQKSSKKMSKAEIMKRNRELNEKRRAMMNTKG